VELRIAAQLNALNRQFYQTFAVQFAATRQRLQPGVKRVIRSIAPLARLLDLGSGNGELARQLAHCGHRGLYVGLDFSPELLSAGQTSQLPSNFVFLQADLTDPAWSSALINLIASSPATLILQPATFNLQPFTFDIILAFAVLHHLPGAALRRQLMRQVNNLLPPGGRFIHSNWQFLNSPRLAARIQPWESIGLNASDVEPGDYLLDWRSGGRGLRYVHHFDADELTALASETGFSISESFLSDGEGGRLGVYQVWEKGEWGEQNIARPPAATEAVGQA
jgi:SAM-dependent methyltransferase